MNLIVAARHEGPLMRFNVEGAWREGDALKLAYMVKASAARVRQDNVLIDLRGVTSAPGGAKFLIFDRLRRALNPKLRVGVLGEADLVDGEGAPSGLADAPDLALFGAEPDALRWLGRRSVDA